MDLLQIKAKLAQKKRRPTWLSPDAGAMPRTATYLVNGKGLGQLRQRR
jgi:hypothetical protein